MKHRIVFVLCFSVFFCDAQNGIMNTFKGYYPIAERPAMSFGVGNNDYEEILFDAKPNVYYGVYNDLARILTSENGKWGDAIYITFQPHIRMYTENSLPIKTPSYRILGGVAAAVKSR